MERKESLCRTPEYTMDMIKDMYKEEVARALRLSTIMDILGDDYDIDRLRELVEADRDGRCVILPCKDWFEIVFGEQETFYGIDNNYEENPLREITVCNEDRFTWYDGWKTVVLKGRDENGLEWEFSLEDIGKTVFLTREAAEGALKGDQDAAEV